MPDGLDNVPSMTRVRRSKEEAQAAYDWMSLWYDWLAAPSEEEHVSAGLRTLDAHSGERVLEIGFGTGRALVSLAQLVQPSGRVYGVDISEGMGQRAATRLEAAGYSDEVELICGDGARLPIAERTVNGVFMSFTLELFDTPRISQVLSECERVLKRQGRMGVVSLSKRRKSSLPVRLYEWVHDALPRYLDCRPIPLEGVLQDAGFEIVDVDRRSMWGLPVDAVLATTSCT